MSQESWSEWIGKQEGRQDLLDLNRAEGLRATLESLDAPFKEGAGLPELWHWAYFWSIAPMSKLGYDGHAAKGEFLPPIALPRRMWGGSRLTWHRPLRLGLPAERQSEIKKVAQKEGRSGKLAFVTVGHRYLQEGGLCLEEEHDIVYREAAKPGAVAPSPEPAPETAAWSRQISPDPVLLFRYSALTFNGHRIHYDQPFATGPEGYSGLIVHGPLLATFMVDLARRNAGARKLGSFSFRALSPIFDTAPFGVCGEPDQTGAKLWVSNATGGLAMQGRVDWA